MSPEPAPAGLDGPVLAAPVPDEQWPMVSEVSEIPECDIHKLTMGIAGIPADYDAETKSGIWGFMCTPCFQQHGVGLGLGVGQRLRLKGGQPAADESAAREAPPPLHPRYQGIWEERDEDWPDDELWEVNVTTHDLTERSWLTPAHQAALDAGTLDLPDRVNDHPSVLVSIPYEAAGTQVAWIDKGCAELVYHSARLGAPTAESCENAGEANGWADMPTFWFNDDDERDRFTDLVLPLYRGDGWRWYKPYRRPLERLASVADWLLPGLLPWPEPSPVGPFAVAIPADDLPRVAAALREIPTPSPYGPLPYETED